MHAHVCTYRTLTICGEATGVVVQRRYSGQESCASNSVLKLPRAPVRPDPGLAAAHGMTRRMIRQMHQLGFYSSRTCLCTCTLKSRNSSTLKLHAYGLVKTKEFEQFRSPDWSTLHQWRARKLQPPSSMHGHPTIPHLSTHSVLLPIDHLSLAIR
jgi:hypothetical protein